MDFQAGIFYLFSAVLLFAAFRVVTARNPVHAVLFLMLAFSQAAALWLLLKAEFLGITLVLVYLGAVMVLFLSVLASHMRWTIDSMVCQVLNDILLSALVLIVFVFVLVSIVYYPGSDYLPRKRR